MEYLLNDLQLCPTSALQDHFYRVFPLMNCDHTDSAPIISKVWGLIECGTLRKDLIYLAVLVNKNFELLNRCIEWNKSKFQFNIQNALAGDSNALFDYTRYKKRHWLYELINYSELAPKNVATKLNYLQLIKITNQTVSVDELRQLIGQCNDEDIDEFWLYFVEELKYMLNIVDVLNTDGSFSSFLSQNTTLAIAAKFAKNPKEVDENFHKIRSLQAPHEEDFDKQHETLKSFMFFSEFFKLILPEDGLDVNETVRNIQAQFKYVSNQFEMLKIMLQTIFLKQSSIKTLQNLDQYVCKDKQVQAILFTLKLLIEELQLNSVNHQDLIELHKIVTDGVWRLELVTHVVESKKCEENILHYMLAEPKTLINLCLKANNFERAYQVLKIFNLETSALAHEVVRIEQLQMLKQAINRTKKFRQLQPPLQNIKLQFEEVIQDFFKSNPLKPCEEWDELIKRNVETHPFLETFKSDNDVFMMILDLAVTQTESVEESRELLWLASSYNNFTSPFSEFYAKLYKLFNEKSVPLRDLLVDPSIPLDIDQYKSGEEFYGNLILAYDELLEELHVDQAGGFNKDHKSHKGILKLNRICQHKDHKYLQKLFTYLKAFSRVLYIEEDSTSLVANGRESSYFDLLKFNRSELMGQLLFQKHLEPNEFERYFNKMKLDFLYHVTGNCFPTINLVTTRKVEGLFPENRMFPPNMAVINYIKKRNWLIALILVKMYDQDVEVIDDRMQTYANYLNLDRIQQIQSLFDGNKIVGSLHHEICLEKLEKSIGNDWKKALDMINAVPEYQKIEFCPLKDSIILKLISTGSEHLQYLFDIENVEIRRNLLIENMMNWPVDVCLTMVKWELTKFDEEPNEELRMWQKHIEFGQKLMIVLEVEGWSQMYEMCATEPRMVWQKILAKNKMELLIEFIELHEVTEAMLKALDDTLICNALEAGSDLGTVLKLLDFLPNRTKICNELLNRLTNIHQLKFITDYLLKQSNDQDLLNIQTSLNILMKVPDIDMLKLLRHPLTIIEVLIMNTKLTSLGEILNENHLPQREVDHILRKYAAKSLDFRILTQPEPRLLRTPEHKLLQSLDTLQLDPDVTQFVIPKEVPAKTQWIGNQEVVECMCCRNIQFSMFNRRHHCRRCGRVICGTCSENRMLVPTYEDVMVRVCLDCYQHDSADECEIAMEEFWMLTDDVNRNQLVRAEFSYEFAPSVSLCLTLIKLHSEGEEKAKFLMNQCEHLLQIVICTQEPMQEIDYMLVVRMLRSLALATKLAAPPTIKTDHLSTQVDLLNLLAERDCLHLLPRPSGRFIDESTLRKLIDKLLDRELWQLALEVSTKGGLNTSGVFMAWGLSCLKAGLLAEAREKFNKHFEIKNASLLSNILKILENINQQIDSSWDTTEPNFILSKRRYLKDIECGYYPRARKNLNEFIYQECEYYLEKYGTGGALAEFHIKYQRFDKAVDTIIERSVSPETFVAIYNKCLKEDDVTQLQARMSEIDSSLARWKDYLVKVCSYLAKHNLLHSLYQLQLYMGDYVRAALTSIRFYQEKVQTFTDLVNNQSFLKHSLRHLALAKDQDEWIAVSVNNLEHTFEESSISSPLVKKLSKTDIDKHMTTIEIQLVTAEFLAECEKCDNTQPMQVYQEIVPNPKKYRKFPPPSLFGSEDERMYIAVLCIVCPNSVEKGHQFVLRIFKEFKQIKPIKVYKEATKRFVETNQINKILELVNCIRKTTDNETNEICDDILIFSVGTLKIFYGSAAAKTDELIKQIWDKSIKISAYIEANQLMTAYSLAVKHKKWVDLRKILREAELAKDQAVIKLCKRVLDKQGD